MTPLGLAGHWWSDFWYRPAPAVNLAAARIIFSLHALWILWSRDLAATSALPEAFWAGVSASERWRFLLFPGDGSLDRLLQRAAAVALIAAAVGIGPRLACFAASLLLYHLAPLETIYWTPNPFERGFTVSVLVLLVLSVSPSGDALAIWPRPKPRAPSSDYRWPLVLCQLLLVPDLLHRRLEQAVRGRHRMGVGGEPPPLDAGLQPAGSGVDGQRPRPLGGRASPAVPGPSACRRWRWTWASSASCSGGGSSPGSSARRYRSTPESCW